MKDYASELFEEGLQKTPQKRDYATELYEEGLNANRQEQVDVQRHFVPSKEISTITGKPVSEFSGSGGSGASFLTHLKTGFVDDPITKVRIYAASRFPDLDEDERMSRYKVQNGEVIFKADDGKWYSESPDLFSSKLKKFIATSAADPSVVTGTLGAAYGPGGAMLGAAAGEGVRKAIGTAAFGEPRDTASDLIDIGLTGATGLIGELGGRGAVGVYHKGKLFLRGRDTSKIGKAIGRDISGIDIAEAIRLKKHYKDKFGVDLFDAQTTESRRLLDKINLYGDLPPTADLVQAAKRLQDEQAHRAAQAFFNEIYKPVTPLESGEKLSAAAKKAIDEEVQRMKSRAGPWYKKAFSDKRPIDISPIIKEIDTKIGEWPLNSAERKKLVQFRNLFYKQIDVTQDGKKAKALVPEDRLVVLDRIKKSVDAMLRPSVSDAPVDKQVKADIREIKNTLLEHLDKKNNDYSRARAIWGDDAEALSELTNKTRLKGIADLEGDNVTVAARRLFGASNNSPDIVQNIKERIYKQDKKAWNSAVRVYLEDIFDSASVNVEGNASKVFNNFYRKTVGNPRQDKILKAALSRQQYENLQDFGDMLRRVGLIGRRESTTATRLVSTAEEMSYGRNPFLDAATRPLMTYQRIAGDKLNEFLSDRAKRQLVETLLSPDSTKHLKRIKRLGPGTQQGVRQFSTFLSLVLGNEFSNNLEE